MTTQVSAIAKLESLLARKKQLVSLGVSLDAYSRWGKGCDPDFEAFAVKELEDRRKVTKKLEALVDKLNRSAPEVLVAWAEAHITLLQNYVEARVGAAEGELARTEAFVAKRELEEWRKVARGELRYVDSNPVYVKPDPDFYEQLFGIPAPELYY